MSNDMIAILLITVVNIFFIVKTKRQTERTNKWHEFDKKVLHYRIKDLQAQIKSLTELKKGEK